MIPPRVSEHATAEGYRIASTTALAAAALGVWATLYWFGRWWWFGPMLCFLLLGAVVAMHRAAPAARSIAILSAGLGLATSVGLLWQISMLLVLAASVLLWRRWPALAPSATWRTKGSIPVLPTLAVALVTPAALLTWWVLLRPDLRDVVSTYRIPHVGWVLLALGGLGFAWVNATLEELLFRGLLLDRLQALWPSRVAPVVTQACVFGLCHLYGVPRGPWGVVMAGTWAVMLGWLRQRSGGLLAPTLAHWVADVLVVAMVFAAMDPL